MGLSPAQIGTIAGTAVSWIGNGIATWQANKGWRAAVGAAEGRLEDSARRKREAADHRDKVYYQDPTQTAENQAAVTQGQQLLDEQTRQARASKAVTGATDESIALQKAANAATVGNMIQQQAVQGQARKDQEWQNWQAQDNAIENERDLWTRYKADTEKAKYLQRAQSIQNTANMIGSSLVQFGQG